jgi:hypothetical protein
MSADNVDWKSVRSVLCMGAHELFAWLAVHFDEVIKSQYLAENMMKYND